jgi:hypothetical protein
MTKTSYKVKLQRGGWMCTCCHERYICSAEADFLTRVEKNIARVHFLASRTTLFAIVRTLNWHFFPTPHYFITPVGDALTKEIKNNKKYRSSHSWRSTKRLVTRCVTMPPYNTSGHLRTVPTKLSPERDPFPLAPGHGASILPADNKCRTIERERDWWNMVDVLLSLSGEYI